MAVFICYRQGCAGEVVGAGLCRTHLREEAKKKKEAEQMTNKADEKPERKAPEPLRCSKCGRKKGEDGVTIYAKECSICRNSSKAKPPEPDKKNGGDEPKTPEPETEEPVLIKEPCHIDKKIPGEPGAPPSDEAITIEVDFTRYPNIHKSLLELAEKEFRTPSSQLLFLLHDHLAGLEETATKQEGAADGR